MLSLKPDLSDAAFETWYAEAVRPRRLLIVDDEALIHAAVELAIRGFNCNVHSAFSGQQGIDAYKSINPDVVWLDMKLGGMDGLEVFRQIRSHEREQKKLPIPVVFVSGWIDQSAMDQIYKIGMALLLRKPDDTRVTTLHQVFRHLHIPYIGTNPTPLTV